MTTNPIEADDFFVSNSSCVVLHSITDDQLCEYQGLKSMAQKILQAHRAGNLGLIKERERLMTQLAEILDPLHADVKPPRHYLETT